MIYLPQILATIIQGVILLYRRNVKSVFNGTETVSYRAQKTWNIVPENIKNTSSLKEFISLIKKWEPNNCTCRLCKTYIDGIRFADIIDQALLYLMHMFT